MPGNYAVLVDAGFLKAEGAKAVGMARDNLTFDGAACIEWFSGFYRDSRFSQLAPIFADKAFLRAYWYDGAFDPNDRRYQTQRAVFEALAIVPGLYLRLGHLQERRPSWQRRVQRAVQACGVSVEDFEKHFRFRSELEQKGVDALMTLDLVNLSRDRVADAILLVSGDRDLEEAVRVAQGVGCKVVLAHPRAAGVALALRELADARLSMGVGDLQQMLVHARPPLVTAEPEVRSARPR
jgi:uncharacterized LabA/DUF88 family protein